jgi:predicted nucleotidyltransferase
MNFDVSSRTIFLARHGSHAYGLNTPTSDEDFKGVCVKPKEAYFGFLNRFEQQEHMGSKSDGIDKVVYSLDKFAHLAADCNPSIIEVLFVDDSDVLKCDAWGEQLRENRDHFLSKKARFTFAGYSHSQLKRIKTHRAWLLDPPKAPPARQDFGLDDVQKVDKSELGAFDSLLGLDTVDDKALTSPVEQAEAISAIAVAKGIELPKNVITLFTREKAWRAAQAHWSQYQNWLKTRNPVRAELEAKHGFDTKHGMHLLRLLMMAVRLLREGTVTVKWQGAEREYLMGVRNGMLAYDPLVEEAERLDNFVEELYKTSDVLPKEPDRNYLDQLIVGMTETYLRAHG